MRRRIRLLIPIAFGWLLVRASSIQASASYFTVPLSIDDNGHSFLPSGLVLEAEFDSYSNLSFVTLSQGDPADRAFFDILSSFHNEDPDLLLTRTSPTLAGRIQALSYVHKMRRLIASAPPTMVVGRVHLASGFIYFISLPQDSGRPSVFGYPLLQQANGDYLWSDEADGSILYTISETIKAFIYNPTQYKPLPQSALTLARISLENTTKSPQLCVPISHLKESELGPRYFKLYKQLSSATEPLNIPALATILYASDVSFLTKVRPGELHDWFRNRLQGTNSTPRIIDAAPLYILYFGPNSSMLYLYDTSDGLRFIKIFSASPFDELIRKILVPALIGKGLDTGL